VKKGGICGEGRDLSKGGPFQPSGKIPVELPDHPPLFILEAGPGKLPFLDHQAEAESQQGDARQQNRREEEKDLSPVGLRSHGPEPPYPESSSI
jgi:hypothetical protein